MYRIGKNLPRNTSIGPKRNGLIICGLKSFIFRSSGRQQYVRQPPGCEDSKAWWHKNHGVGMFFILWCWPIYHIPEIMNQFEYSKMLEEIILPYAAEEMPLKWVFQQDPKHTSKQATSWFQTKGNEVMEWPAQSPDLKPH